MNIFNLIFSNSVNISDEILGTWQCGPHSSFNIAKFLHNDYRISFDLTNYKRLTIKDGNKLYYHDDKKPLLMWLHKNKLAVYTIWPWKHIDYLGRISYENN